MTHPSNTGDIKLDLPLVGIRVVELAGKLASCARLLADLGAQVILVEPPAGSSVRNDAPHFGDISLAFEAQNANKLSVTIDLDSAAGVQQFQHLLASADMLIDATTPGTPGTLHSLGMPPAQLRAQFPRLVVMNISDFGLTGPSSGQLASPAVHAATSGFLCRSGLPEHPPLLPPGNLIASSAAMQAAWVALLALWQQIKTETGDTLDFSIQEAVAQVLDPPLGVTGSASAGRSALDSTPHGRPPAMPLYPIIACRDGHVRICVLNPRQWSAMSEWLGPEHPFTDPQYANIAKRMAVAAPLNQCIAELFSTQDSKALVAEGQRRGVPIAAVATPEQVLKDEQFNARGAFQRIELSNELSGSMPSGYFEIDGARVGYRERAPSLGEHTQQILANLAAHNGATHQTTDVAIRTRRPLEGIRVLDLGVIVAGAEAGRILADQGAEVIKVENRAFPDGGRQSMTGAPMTSSIAQGHRNKLSMGINLRSETGRQLFKELAAKSDVILSNFKPGTLESLGLGYDVLGALNPRIIMMDSSALGNTGPQSRSLGYGPLVRAATGLTWLWRYPEKSDAYCDGVTIYPDHLAARVAASGVLSLLIRRERTGRGGTVSLSQAEIFLNANADHFLHESLQPGSFQPWGNTPPFHAPEGVYPCAGNDQWCVVSVHSDMQWEKLTQVLDRKDLAADLSLATNQGRCEQRARVEEAVAGWVSLLSPQEVTKRLQDAGIPSGTMIRLSELRDDAHLAARAFIRTLEHAGLSESLPTENMPVHSLSMPAPELRPAPYQAEHTRELAQRVLGLNPERIDSLIANGDLEDMTALQGNA